MSLVVLVLGVSDAAGAAAAGAATGVPAPVLTTAPASLTMDTLDDAHRLGEGDHVTFRIVEDRDEPKALIVTASAELEVPYLNRVVAGGKTCRQLAYELKRTYETNLYHQATVLISIDSLNKVRGKVYLVGAVRAPGSQEIPIDEVFTVSKAILKAGGFTEFANRKSVKVTRKTGTTEKDNKVFLLNVEEIWEKNKTDADLRLQPGDLIFVPDRFWNF
jgi:protein involved in polysaccharide export with SLBB domain